LYADGAYANIATTPSADLMSAAVGAVASPTVARTNTLEASASHSTVNIICVGAGTVAQNGMAVLCGKRNDGRGNGELKVMNHVSTDAIGLAQALNAPMAVSDVIVYSTTTYLDEDATQQYVDHVAVGKGTADQRQSIGGAAMLTGITAMAPGETPKLDLEVFPSDHQWVPSTGSQRTTMSKGTAPQGQNPSQGGIGMCHIGDYGTSTRTVVKCADLTVTPNVSHEAAPEFTGPNGIGGWCKIPGVVTGEATLLIDEDFGLVADWEAKTEKTIIFQMGHTPGRTFGVEYVKCTLDALPQRVAVGNLTGMKITFHGDEAYVSGSAILSSSLRIHQA